MSFSVIDKKLLGSATSRVVKSADYQHLVAAREVLAVVRDSAAHQQARMEAAQQQGMREGFAAGIEKGKDAWARELTARHLAGKAQLKPMHATLVEVVMNSLHHLVAALPAGRQFELLAQQVVTSVVRARHMRLVVAAADAESARTVLERWQQQHPDVLTIDVAVDNALAANDCILETEEGAVDGRLQHRLALIEASLRDHLSALPYRDAETMREGEHRDASH